MAGSVRHEDLSLRSDTYSQHNGAVGQFITLHSFYHSTSTAYTHSFPHSSLAVYTHAFLQSSRKSRKDWQDEAGLLQQRVSER
jgi:hypothetical protein